MSLTRTSGDTIGRLLLAAGFCVQVYGWALFVLDPSRFSPVAVGAGLVVFGMVLRAAFAARAPQGVV